MRSDIFTNTASIPSAMIRELANSGALDEISNIPGSVRHHIFHHSIRDKKSGKTQKPLLFAIYQTGRYGPQNGYRLCLVHAGYYIASAERGNGDAEDEIDIAEKDIPQGHEEMVVLGEPLTYVSDSDNAAV
jgi:hypothetical protein